MPLSHYRHQPHRKFRFRGVVKATAHVCKQKPPTYIHVDIDECTASSDNCDDSLATCTNTVGSFMCTCTAGYTGDGVTCAGIAGSTVLTCYKFCHDNYYTDINECTMGTDNCAPEATCTNTEGSFSCTCNQVYTGSGTSCTGKVLIQNHYVTC